MASNQNLELRRRELADLILWATDDRENRAALLDGLLPERLEVAISRYSACKVATGPRKVGVTPLEARIRATALEMTKTLGRQPYAYELGKAASASRSLSARILVSMRTEGILPAPAKRLAPRPATERRTDSDGRKPDEGS